MYPSEVRRQVLREHQGLRAQLERIEALADDLRRGERDAGDRRGLRERVEQLARAVEAHERLEDELLGPALEESTNWRKVCIADMHRYHETQRREVATTLQVLRNPEADAARLARAVGRLVRVLRADLECEERDLLAPALLRDDPLMTDNVSG